MVTTRLRRRPVKQERPGALAGPASDARESLRNLSRGLRHERDYSLWMFASREGSLIQAMVGSAGGVGRWPRKRSGFAA